MDADKIIAEESKKLKRTDNAKFKNKLLDDIYQKIIVTNRIIKNENQ